MSVWTELCFANISGELSRRFSLSAANLPVFLPLSRVRILLISIWTGFTFLAKVFQGEFNQCLLRFLWRLLFCLSAPLSGSFKEGPAGVCLDWVRVSSISFWWTHQGLLEVSPTACLSVSPSGTLGFLLGGLAGAFDVCCSVFLDSPIHRDWGLSITLYHSFIWVFSLFLMKLAFTLLLSL